MFKTSAEDILSMATQRLDCFLKYVQSHEKKPLIITQFMFFWIKWSKFLK